MLIWLIVLTLVVVINNLFLFSLWWMARKISLDPRLKEQFVDVYIESMKEKKK